MNLFEKGVPMYICICNGITDHEIVETLDKIKNINSNIINESNEVIVKVLQHQQYLDFEFNCGTCLTDFHELINKYKLKYQQ